MTHSALHHFAPFRLLFRPMTALLVGGLITAGGRGADAQTFRDTVQTNGGNNLPLSSLFGAAAFYDAGYTGKRAIVANIEGGLFYRYSPLFSGDTVQLAYGGPTPTPPGPDPTNASQPNLTHDANLTNDALWKQYDMHATAVSGVTTIRPPKVHLCLARQPVYRNVTRQHWARDEQFYLAGNLFRPARPDQLERRRALSGRQGYPAQ